MNSACDSINWQTWSENWGNWNHWCRASLHGDKSPDFDRQPSGPANLSIYAKDSDLCPPENVGNGPSRETGRRVNARSTFQ